MPLRLERSTRILSLAVVAITLVLVCAERVMAQEAIRPAKGTDPLLVPVSIAIRGAPIGEALQELQAQSGVRLRLTPEVKDQRITLFLRNRPLREALSGIAKLLHHRWTKEPPVYS